MVEARSPEAERLLALVADHVVSHGVSGLSLSRLATAVGSNNRMLLYYFGSKDALLGAAMQRVYARNPVHRNLMRGLQQPGDLSAQLRTAWRSLRAEDNLPYIRLFFEAFGVAVRDPDGNRTQLNDIATQWPRDLTRAFMVHGYDEQAAAATAVQLLALWRGLQFALLEGVDTGTLDDAHDRGVDALLRDAV